MRRKSNVILMIALFLNISMATIAFAVP